MLKYSTFSVIVTFHYNMTSYLCTCFCRCEKFGPFWKCKPFFISVVSVIKALNNSTNHFAFSVCSLSHLACFDKKRKIITTLLFWIIFGRNKSIKLISRIMFPHWLSEGVMIREYFYYAALLNAKYRGACKSLHLCLPSWLSPAIHVVMALSSMQLQNMEHEDESRDTPLRCIWSTCLSPSICHQNMKVQGRWTCTFISKEDPNI